MLCFYIDAYAAVLLVHENQTLGYSTFQIKTENTYTQKSLK